MTYHTQGLGQTFTRNGVTTVLDPSVGTEWSRPDNGTRLRKKRPPIGPTLPPIDIRPPIMPPPPDIQIRPPIVTNGLPPRIEPEVLPRIEPRPPIVGRREPPKDDVRPEGPAAKWMALAAVGGLVLSLMRGG